MAAMLEETAVDDTRLNGHRLSAGVLFDSWPVSIFASTNRQSHERIATLDARRATGGPQ